jgi:tight adherence protein B
VTGVAIVVATLAALVALAAAGAGSPRSTARARVRLASAAGPAAADRRRPRGPAPAVVALAIGGLGAAWLAAGPPAAVALGALAAAAPAVDTARRRGASRHARDVQLPQALDRLATALRSGSSLALALDEVSDALDPPLGPEIAALAAAARRGRPLPQVLDEWSAVRGDPGTRLAATALVLATVVGSAPARAVDGVAATLRERLDLAGERRALAVQARTSALVLSVAPVGFATLLVLADTAAAGFLLGSPAGWACLTAGVTLDVIGAWWMARLSRGGAS